MDIITNIIHANNHTQTHSLTQYICLAIDSFLKTHIITKVKTADTELGQVQDSWDCTELEVDRLVAVFYRNRANNRIP